DWKAFITFASERYHDIVSKAVKAYDPHHMYLGEAHCNGHSIEWIAGSTRYVDAFLLHDYSVFADWINSNMATYRQLDKPLLVTEYSFVVRGHGFRPYNGNNTVATQQQRGLAYRYFTEQLAANPLVMGFSWFIYYDQPVTMRSLPYGENYNFGLVNECDQPYYDMIAEMQKSNARLFSIHQGGVLPVTAKTLGLMPTGRLQTMSPPPLPDPIDPSAKMDYSNPEYFAGDWDRIKIDEADNPAVGTHAVCTWYAGDGKKYTDVSMTVYLWKNLPQTPEGWFGLSESADNVHFTPVAVTFRPGTPGEFNQFIMVPKDGLNPTTRYLQLTLTVKDPSHSWVNEVGDVHFTTSPLNVQKK
ncbi:MAG TPA: hypothetical protein VHV83_03695, partial [Armatimonadota bacterium]|nr:hypothetical protein [Armatimonadota bacterium]